MNQARVQLYVVIVVMKQSSKQLKKIVIVNFIGVVKFVVNDVLNVLKNIFVNEQFSIFIIKTRGREREVRNVSIVNRNLFLSKFVIKLESKQTNKQTSKWNRRASLTKKIICLRIGEKKSNILFLNQQRAR